MTNANATETWTDLWSALTHELRLDVSAVLHQVELLGDSRLDDATRQRSLAAIDESAETLVRFTDDLSELGRIARGDVRPACRDVALAELLETSEDGDRCFRLDSSDVTGLDTMVHTDPVIAHHIVGSILGELPVVGVGGLGTVAVVDRSGDQYVDVVFRDAIAPASSPSSAYRSVTPEDGLATFVAREFAELVGARLDVLGPVHPSAYRLRLPSFPAPDGAVPSRCDE